MLISCRSACFALPFWLGVARLAIAAAGDVTPPDIDRYVGSYAMSRHQVMRVVREESHLVAQPPGNMPSADLVADNKPGKFGMRGAAFEFQFVIDDSGRIARLDITAPDGTVRRLPRIPDTAAVAASVRAAAVAADTAVNARVFNGYERSRDAAGNFRVETYAFGEGGRQSTNPMRDDSIDGISFEQLAQLLAPGLAGQNFVAATDPEQTDLLVMIYWGATASEDHPSVIAQEERDPLQHSFRDQLNRENAELLGFESVLSSDDPGARSQSVRDSMERLEESRYWIALVAVDFQLLRREKKTKPLWSVRYNMASRGTSFTKALPQMTQVAAHFFGRDSHGLLERGTLDVEGTIDFGEAIVIEEGEDEAGAPGSQKASP